MMTSRRSLIEREKAMEAARNPGASKFGDCLITSKAKTDKMLVSNIRKINSEIRRMQLQVNQRMKHFVKNSAVLNHDPLILVERPPSPDVVKKAHLMTNYADLDTHFYPPVDEEDECKPSYMRQLRSKARTPSTLTTIDAFTVKARKKKNVWEGAVDEKTPPTFLSTVRPFAKLTRREISDLQKGYDFHKPKLENNSSPDIHETSNVNKKKKAIAKKTNKVYSDESDAEDIFTPFITQMADIKLTKELRGELESVSDAHTPTPSIKGVKSPSNHSVKNKKHTRFQSPLVSSAKLSRRKQTTTATVVAY